MELLKLLQEHQRFQQIEQDFLVLEILKDIKAMLKIASGLSEKI